MQKSEEWLTTATPNQILAAQEAHELDDLLGIVRNASGNTAGDMRRSVSNV